MFNQSRALLASAGMLTLLTLSGCGGSDVESGQQLSALTCGADLIPDASNSQCVAPPPPICSLPLVLDVEANQCKQPPDPNSPVPSVFAAVDQAVLFYNRPQDASNDSDDPVYDRWKLHTWSDASCDAYADTDTLWKSGRVHDGVDANYGAYWLLDLKPGYADTEGACANFILHDGDDKELSGSNSRMVLDQTGEFARMNWSFSRVADIFESPIASLGVSIGDASAHWLDVNTLVWNFDSVITDVSSAKLVHSASADIAIEGDALVNGSSFELTQTTLTEEQAAKYPQFANWSAFSGNWSSSDAQAALKNQLVIAGFDAANALSSANKIQIAKVIDALYTQGEDDADEARLGLIYDNDTITAALWAPTAQDVKLKVFNADKSDLATHDMSYDAAKGIWSYNGDSSLDRQFYLYQVTVYHPATGKIEVLETTDPYSVSLATNGRYSQFVNLNDDDLKPEGWDEHIIPTIAKVEDAVIYEGHIRDFSIRDESTEAANRGKYLAFAQVDSAPVAHLTKLVENGLTHFHMLPANDIGSINEDENQTVDLNSTVAKLCELNSGATVCGVMEDDMTLLSVFESYSAVSEPLKAQQLTADMRGFDRFNWGYDPHHFNTPEGSYSSNPDGVARIKEMREMNQALHTLGLRVALDVVYNHTNASGLNENSVFDKVVPGYYHRYDINSGSIIRETCCDDTEPRNRMMEKFMQDSLVQWTIQYKFDSFRFDIMSQASKATMLTLRDAVLAVDPDNYFYGEGWNRTDRAYEQANQVNMAGSEIGTFNDRIREAVRQGEIFSKEASNSALAAQDKVKMSLAGTLSDYVLKDFNGIDATTSSLGGYAQDPADIINYVSKHDNETLWDQLQYVLPADLTLAERVRAQNIAATLPLMAQGIPFLQLGGDMLRSKSMDRNSYDSGDWFNTLDFTMNSNNWNMGLPLAEDNQGRWDEMATFIYSPERAAAMTEIEFASSVFNEMLSMRSQSPLLHLSSAEEIIQRVGFHNIGKNQTQGLIVMSLDDGINELELIDLDPSIDAMVVVINTSYQEQSHTVSSAAGFALHATQANSIDPDVRGASFIGGDNEGTFVVPPLTTAIFVKAQDGAQGLGLSANATAGAPDVVPYGSTEVFVRGDMNGWNPTNELEYVGAGLYQEVITLAPGTYGFKVASNDWSSVDLGAIDGEQVVVLDNEQTLVVSGANMSFTTDVEATFMFSLDASNTESPVFKVSYEEPFFGTPVLIRGSMNNWENNDAMDYAVGGQYSLTMDLDAGSYEFKIASNDWSTVDFGSGDADNQVILGEQKLMAVGGANLTLDIPTTGSYTFVFNAKHLSEPTFAVFNAQMFGDTTAFVRGSMNGWDPVSTLTYDGNGAYFVDISMEAGSYEFKIASENWDIINLGAGGEDAQVSLDVEKQLAPVGANMMLEIDTSATYRFTVRGPDPSNPTLTVTLAP